MFASKRTAPVRISIALRHEVHGFPMIGKASGERALQIFESMD